MRWWRGLSSGLFVLVAAHAACGGRSKDVSGAESGGAAASAGRGGGSGGASASEGATTGLGARAGNAGSSAGSSLDCTCDEVCHPEFEWFCNAGGDFDCPLRLNDVRQLEAICDADAERLVYSDCDGIAVFVYSVPDANVYDLMFSKETGSLVYGYASLYGDSRGCEYPTYLSGTLPERTDCHSCKYCYDDGSAWVGRDLPRCKLDVGGRVIPPGYDCECVDELCELAPEAFCPKKIPFACPLRWEQVRARWLCDQVDERGGTFLLCDDARAVLSWSNGIGEETTLVFSTESGELVYGHAARPVDMACALSRSERIAGEPVTLENCRSCVFCSDADSGAAGAGGAAGDAATVCLFDNSGHLLDPE